MRTWGQLIIILAVFILPLASKILQSIVEQYKANQERKKSDAMGRNSGVALVDRQEKERQGRQLEAKRRDEARRAELARRRQAQLEAWRARKSGGRGTGSQLQTRVGSAPPAVNSPDLLSAQTGDQLIRDMMAQRAQQAKRVQQQRQSQTSRQRAAAPAPTRTKKRTVKRGHQHDPNDRSVHRLVQSDEEKRSWAKTPSGRSRVEVNAGGGSESRTAPSIIQSMMHSPNALRNAFILKELLEPPLALRETD